MNNNMLAPLGALGELYIGGDGIAEGYLNNLELSKEKFINNPLLNNIGTHHSQKIYRTGDIVKWLPCGNLEFIGRLDLQVKIRGFRVELGDVETAIIGLPCIKSAVVKLNDFSSGIQNLIAYIVTNNEVSLENQTVFYESLRKDLGLKLPDYMVPTVFVNLKNLPLTSNGKIDRKNLPQPEIIENQNELVEPKTDTEKLLCELWKNVLEIDKISTKDHFFTLGGHSLLAMKMLAKLEVTFEIEILISTFFISPTIESTAALIDATKLADLEFSDDIFFEEGTI
jgi:acyl carrier protein